VDVLGAVGRCCRYRAAIVAGIGFVLWWALLLGLLARLDAGGAAPARVGVAVGGVVSVSVPSLQAWPIPTDRATFDDYRRALRDDDEGALAEITSRAGWIAVADRQVVRVAAVDGAAAQIEVLDGEHVQTQPTLWLRIAPMSVAIS
jgi:hypothetical protein